jgi:2-C-methyl-D-erythritol 4-phosphate cytidylyltransferase
VAEAAVKCGAACPVLPLAETPKETAPDVDPDGLLYIERHLKRARLGAAQTPQGFAFPQILEAHEKAAAKVAGGGPEYTDDAEIWADFVGKVAAVPGSPDNRKITWPSDLSASVLGT